MKDPIHPMQAMVDGMNAAWQRERATTQMTLGALIAALEALDPERWIAGLGKAMSYRGYYSDLAFEPDALRTVREVLIEARACMGKVFEGYKGGDFMMGESTPLWRATYGSCGPRIMGLDLAADPIGLILREHEEG